MSKTEEISTLPIAGWELKAVPAYDAILISFAYLSHALQKPEEAVTDRTYVIHAAQAEDLAQRILALLGRMKTGDAPGSGPQQH